MEQTHGSYEIYHPSVDDACVYDRIILIYFEFI